MYEMVSTSEWNVQWTDSCLQDGDHTDGHYLALFAEQLTRTFEVLVFYPMFSGDDLLALLNYDKYSRSASQSRANSDLI